MSTSDIIFIALAVILVPIILSAAYLVVKQLINDYRIDNSINFPEINEIEYRDSEDDSGYPEIGSFYIKKENAEKNPFIYPRYIYRVDSIKKNYYGETWVKVSSRCYDMNAYDTSYTSDFIPLSTFLSENSRIYKSKVKNIETYKSDMKREARKNLLSFSKKNKK